MTQSERKPGERVPDVTFRIRKDRAFQDVTTADLFGGKRVALFALPGAFTPTCSSTHLPGFIGYADKLRAAGIPAELHVLEAAPHGTFGGGTPEEAELDQEMRGFCEAKWSGR